MILTQELYSDCQKDEQSVNHALDNCNVSFVILLIQ